MVVCGDAPVQAAAAGVAAARDLPYVCMPAGPDDLLARDLGMPLDDPFEALKLPFSDAERTIDLGEVNGLPFVNRVAVGVALPTPVARSRGRRSSGERQAEPRTAASETPLPALLVCNNRFALSVDRLGLRDWPSSGQLQIVTFETPGTDRSFAALRAAGFHERTCARFQLALRGELVVDVDGELCRLAPPLRFRSVAAALRVRAPSIEAQTIAAASTRGDPALESIQTG